MWSSLRLLTRPKLQSWVLGGVKRESGKWRVESGRGVVFYAASEWPWPNGNGWLLRAQWKHFPARRYF
uniref:RE40136p n=1 Tax=Drosophila melanogaster TaxID=7227 RepID=F3YDL6_DROME|nr:RE40136p [Drosophila melanogaster]